MARLKGGSHVAGDMTVEGLLTVGGVQIDDNRTIIFSGAGDLNANRIPKGSAFNELVDSNIIDSGTLITLDVNTKISADLEVTGSLLAANIYLEEDENSGNGLKLRNDSGLTGNKSLTFNVNDTDRILELTGDAILNQDISTVASPTLVKLDLTSTVDSTSTVDGNASIVTAGGISCAKDIWALKVHNAVYNDVAEFMYFAKPSKVGEVLIMTPDGVAPSTKRGMKAVVGVHSGSFGYSLGESDVEKKTPIGLTGRVPVYISEKCKIGDALLSGKDGKASVKKWYDFNKSIIGKVMQNKTNQNLEKVEMLILMT